MIAPVQNIAFNLSPMVVTDEVLLNQVIHHSDYKAFERLFHRYYTLLCQRVNSRIGNPHFAEEIVSDVFTKIWRNRANMSINTKVKYYLFTAIKNQTIDYLRKQVKRRKYQYEINRDFQSNFATPEELIIGEELRTKIENAIELLPPQAKHIFRMSRDDGKKYREIAVELNISIRTVETHIRRSLITLRRVVYSEDSKI